MKEWSFAGLMLYGHIGNFVNWRGMPSEFETAADGLGPVLLERINIAGMATNDQFQSSVLVFGQLFVCIERTSAYAQRDMSLRGEHEFTASKILWSLESGEWIKN